MNRRLGCLTGGGLLAAAVTLALVLAFFLARGGRMFSPGPLNAQGNEPLGQVRSHAETGGRCQACHTSPWSKTTLSDRCLACHTSVAGELQTGTGLHAGMLRQAAAIDCRDCHTEHRGPTAALTEVDVATFPHAATGYALTGHRKMLDGRAFACSDCHGGATFEFAIATCTDCHRQLDAATMTIHIADFSDACLGCHDGADRYRRDRFDHNVLAFPLLGKHAQAGCGECHAGAATVADLQEAPHTCADCHLGDDAHDGQFGEDCAGCHNTTAWPDATFDHDQTAFPLTGKHTGVQCGDCHNGGVFEGTDTSCVSCHADPAFHRGVFETQCTDCHTAVSWEPATFNLPHTFPIDHGEEGPAACRVCHPDSVSAYTCYGCHEHNPVETAAQHAEEAPGDISNCVKCHPTGQEEEGED